SRLPEGRLPDAGLPREDQHRWCRRGAIEKGLDRPRLLLPPTELVEHGPASLCRREPLQSAGVSSFRSRRREHRFVAMTTIDHATPLAEGFSGEILHPGD